MCADLAVTQERVPGQVKKSGVLKRIEGEQAKLNMGQSSYRAHGLDRPLPDSPVPRTGKMSKIEGATDATSMRNQPPEVLPLPARGAASPIREAASRPCLVTSRDLLHEEKAQTHIKHEDAASAIRLMMKRGSSHMLRDGR